MNTQENQGKTPEQRESSMKLFVLAFGLMVVSLAIYKIWPYIFAS